MEFPMKPTRSMLFVPGHRKGWAEKAVAAGTDAVILDLEDSVPQDMKAETRHIVADTIRDLARNHPHVGVYVRLNSLETAQAYADCENMIKASPRCATLFAGTARDADVSRSIGFEFTPDGLETLYLRSRAVLATRAAGKNFPIV